MKDDRLAGLSLFVSLNAPCVTFTPGSEMHVKVTTFNDKNKHA